jgi:hypothetical protein
MFVLFTFLSCFLPDLSLAYTLHVALPSGTETLVRHDILIPFPFSLVAFIYQAGTYFAENHGQRGTWNITALGNSNHLCDYYTSVSDFFFVSLFVHFITNVCLEQNTPKIA